MQVQKNRDILVDAVDRDADAYHGVLTAYRLPKTGPAEQAARKQAIQDALKQAARVPMGVTEIACGLLDAAKVVSEKGHKNAASRSPQAISVMLAKTAVLSALENVRVNLGSIADEAFAHEFNEKMAEVKNRTSLP